MNDKPLGPSMSQPETIEASQTPSTPHAVFRSQNELVGNPDCTLRVCKICAAWNLFPNASGQSRPPDSAISICRNDSAPRPDIAICSECGWIGPIENCLTEKEGNYEEGYYDIHLCPVCENGGCIDDYDMSEERQAQWLEWKKQNAHLSGGTLSAQSDCSQEAGNA